MIEPREALLESASEPVAPPPRSASWAAPLAILLALALWASAFTAIRYSVHYFRPTDVAALRMLVAALVFGVYAVFRPLRLPTARDAGMLALSGLTGYTLYQVMLSTGETQVTAGAASLIVNSSPVITVVLASLFLRERIHKIVWVGLVVSFIGAGLIGVGESHGAALRFQPAALLLMIASILTSLYLIFQKPLLNRYTAIEFTVYSIWFGALFAVPLMPHLLRSVPNAPAAAIDSVVYLGIGPTVVAYWAWSYGYARVNLAKAVSSLLLIPIFAIVISFILLKEIPSGLSLAGGLCSVIGVVIVTRIKQAEPARATRK